MPTIFVLSQQLTSMGACSLFKRLWAAPPCNLFDIYLWEGPSGNIVCGPAGKPISIALLTAH